MAKVCYSQVKIRISGHRVRHAMRESNKNVPNQTFVTRPIDGKPKKFGLQSKALKSGKVETSLIKSHIEPS